MQWLRLTVWNIRLWRSLVTFIKLLYPSVSLGGHTYFRVLWWVMVNVFSYNKTNLWIREWDKLSSIWWFNFRLKLILTTEHPKIQLGSKVVDQFDQFTTGLRLSWGLDTLLSLHYCHSGLANSETLKMIYKTS